MGHDYNAGMNLWGGEFGRLRSRCAFDAELMREVNGDPIPLAWPVVACGSVW